MGRYGATVRIYEPKIGARLRWDWRDAAGRHRPDVSPPMRVRRAPDEPTDPVLVKLAEEACEQKAAGLALDPLRRATDLSALTVGHAYTLYFDPGMKALPRSRTARTHHWGSRKFWTEKLGEDTPWDGVAPAVVRAALLGLIEAGRAPTAEKRSQNLTTLYRWLVGDMGMETIRNPMRGIKLRELMEGHKPRRPRYDRAEVEKLLQAANETFDARFALFVVLIADSGARGGQVRLVMRSGLDAALDPPPKDRPPHGWLVLPAMKGQDAHVTFLTARQRAALDTALDGFLAPWEAEWQAEGKDYPLVPGGRLDRGQLVREPITDRALRKMWVRLERAAKVPALPRRAFHGVRRSWADDIEAAHGLDTVTAAGGWSRRETPEQVYVSRRKYGHLERARKRREEPES